MITITNNELMDDMDLVMKKALTDLRRGHVSRFPINVKATSAQGLWFWDSRFHEPEFMNSLGFIARIYKESDGEDVVYKIESSAIKNNRYASYNTKRHQLATKTSTKLLQHMKKYITSLGDQTIAGYTAHEQESGRDNHESKLRDEWYYSTPSAGTTSLMEEVFQMKQLGIVPVTPILKAYYEKLPEFEAYQLATEKKPKQLQVFLQPDESVSVFDGAQSTLYWNMSDCPDNIQQAVAMLNIMEPGSYVPNVGTKTKRDNIYWVEVFED
jgi:hypothetical protein